MSVFIKYFKFTFKKNQKQTNKQRNQREVCKEGMTKTHFIQPPSYQNDYLRQTSTRQITLGKNDDMHGPIIISVSTTLPPYVLPYYWQKFGLHPQDILKQLEHIPARLCWVSALFHGVDVSASSVHPSLSCVEQVTLFGKPTALKKIAKMQKFPWNAKDHSQSQLLDEKGTNIPKQVPPVPFKKVSPDDFKTACKFLISQKHCALFQEEAEDISGFFQFNQMKFVPTQIIDNYVLLKRVVLFEEYQKSQKQQSTIGFASYPPLLTYQGKLFAIVEDALFLCSFV